MFIQDRYTYWLTSKFPPGSLFRLLGKYIFKGCTLKQSFHNGIICFDAVEHSWVWVGNLRYETLDRDLQDKLLALSFNYDLMIDIGANVGVMTLSILLRNKKIKVVCIEPNQRAASLLKKSLSLNHLTERATIIEAVVSNKDGVEIFDAADSVSGHISNSGRPVKCIDFASLLNQYSSNARCLVKIDIEGFEGTLMGLLSTLDYLRNLCMVIELHNLGFNKFGNPGYCLEMLLESGAKVLDLQGETVTQIANNNITQVITSWPHA
jgi:FkbM family methyltransferase